MRSPIETSSMARYVHHKHRVDCSSLFVIKYDSYFSGKKTHIKIWIFVYLIKVASLSEAAISMGCRWRSSCCCQSYNSRNYLTDLTEWSIIEFIRVQLDETHEITFLLFFNRQRIFILSLKLFCFWTNDPLHECCEESNLWSTQQ